jgi:hypothetical protein
MGNNDLLSDLNRAFEWKNKEEDEEIAETNR